MNQGAVLDFEEATSKPEPTYSPVAMRLKPLGAIVAPVLAPFLVSRFVCFLAAYLATLTLLPLLNKDLPAAAIGNKVIDWTGQWDGDWFFNVITQGYRFDPNQQSNVAFFPLYPMTVRGLSSLGLSPVVASFFLNHLAIFGAMAYLHVLARRRMTRADADRALWLFAIFPTSFFFSAMYSESLYLFLVVGCFAHLDRRQWGRAVAFAAVASSCRITGFLLTVAIGMEWMKDAGWTLRRSFDAQAWRNLGRAAIGDWRRLLLFPLGLSGLAAFMVFLYVEFGDPIVFHRAHAAWERHLAQPWRTLGYGLGVLVSSDYAAGLNRHGRAIDFANLFNWFCLVAGLAISVGVWRRFGETFGVFCLASLLIPASTGLMSVSRFTVVLFPLFLWLGSSIRSPNVERTYFAVSTSLLAVFTALFVCKIFVA